MRSRDSLITVKIVTTLIASGLLIVHIAFPAVRLDAVSLGLLAFAVLPWLSPLIRSAQLPGGLRIEFQEVKHAAEMIAAGSAPVRGAGRSRAQSTDTAAMPVPPPATPSPAEPITGPMAIVQDDPNLALISLRLEIEKRLRALADAAGISTRQSLTQLTNDLQTHGILDPRAAIGLRDLLRFGAQAAHGTAVAPEAAYAAVEYAPLVLRALDDTLRQTSTENP